ncbi:hypothetical protein KMI8_55 [Klebsiella phage KMI8]|nr:hypothetical protein KMI8_55 [Klebsiella phage KMI8]
MASIDNIIKFTQQVSAEFPNMEPGEQARLGAKRAEEFETQEGERIESPSKGWSMSRQSIRAILEPSFIAGDYDITIDRHAFKQEHGIELTYQNLRSAFRAHFNDAYRVVIRETDLHFSVTREVKEQARSALDEESLRAVQVERARLCAAVDEVFKDPTPEHRALAMALKIVINNGGEK